jgi:hypothetical protein
MNSILHMYININISDPNLISSFFSPFLNIKTDNINQQIDMMKGEIKLLTGEEFVVDEILVEEKQMETVVDSAPQGETGYADERVLYCKMN